MNQAMPSPPFTVDSLAERWGCSPGAVRKRIRAGEIQTFRIGTLIRIPANEVEKIECPNILSSVSGEASPSSGMTSTGSGAGKLLPRAIGQERRRRPANHGG